MGKKGKKYPAHKIARKKILDDQKSPTPPLTPPLRSLNGRPLNKFLYSLRKLGTINWSHHKTGVGCYKGW